MVDRDTECFQIQQALDHFDFRFGIVDAKLLASDLAGSPPTVVATPAKTVFESASVYSVGPTLNECIRRWTSPYHVP